MRRNDSGLNLVRKLALELPDVAEGTLHGAPSWKVGGKLLTCPAIHDSAEPNSLLVKIDPEERTELLAAQSDTYYLTSHYRNHPVVLVRLSKIDSQSLQALLQRAWQFVSGR
jgi:hypothetical protein